MKIRSKKSLLLLLFGLCLPWLSISAANAYQIKFLNKRHVVHMTTNKFQVAQTITSKLNQDSYRFSDGNFYNIHTFEGNAGEAVLIELFTEETGPALFFTVRNPEGEEIAMTDPWGFDNTLYLKLPSTGEYSIIVTAHDAPNETAQYTLTWKTEPLLNQVGLEDLQFQYRLMAQYRQYGNYSEAIQVAEQIVIKLHQMLGEDHSAMVPTLNDLAWLYQMRGDYQKAELFYQEALSIGRRILGDDSNLSILLNNFANFYLKQGMSNKAQSLLEEALSIRRSTLGENHPLLDASLNRLAELYINRGYFREAQSLLQESLVIKRRVLGNDLRVAFSIDKLADIYFIQNEYEKAKSLYQEAIEMRFSILGDRHLDIAKSYSNLAVLEFAQNNESGVVDMLQRGLTIEDSILNFGINYGSETTQKDFLNLFSSSIDVTLSLLLNSRSNNQDANYLALNTIFQRKGKLLDILAKRRALIEESHNAELQSLLYELNVSRRKLANIVRSRETTITCRDYLEQVNIPITSLNAEALCGYNVSFDAPIDFQSNKVKISDLESHINWLEFQISYHLRLKETRAFLNNIISSSSEKITCQQLLTRLDSPVDSAAAEFICSSASRMENINEVYREQYPHLFTAAEKTNTLYISSILQQLEPQLSHYIQHSLLLENSLTVEKIASSLPADSALIEFVRYRKFDPRVMNLGNDYYAAYLLHSNGDIESFDLGSAEDIDQLIISNLRILRDKTSYLNARDRTSYLNQVKRTSRLLDDRIMAPIRQYLREEINHLIIAPDSTLNLVPFESLVNQEEQYLVEQLTLTYVTSGRDLLRSQVESTPQQQPVIIANPYFGREGQTLSGENPGRGVDLRALRWGALSGTAEEADEIFSLLPNALNIQGLEATEATLKQVNRPKILHIATHGFFEPIDTDNRDGQANYQTYEEYYNRREQIRQTAMDNPLMPLGRLTFNGGGLSQFIPPNKPLELVVEENPLLRSGLVLTGVKIGKSGSGEDGIVSALEVSGLNLLGTELVVLSACETGIGDISAGEGVYGLRRALVIAGAKSQVISLWQVDDFATRDLMVKYYRQLLEGTDRSEALRKAQISLLNNTKTAHPYYWAAFINSGAWEPISLD